MGGGGNTETSMDTFLTCQHQVDDIAEDFVPIAMLS